MGTGGDGDEVVRGDDCVVIIIVVVVSKEEGGYGFGRGSACWEV